MPMYKIEVFGNEDGNGSEIETIMVEAEDMAAAKAEVEEEGFRISGAYPVEDGSTQDVENDDDGNSQESADQSSAAAGEGDSSQASPGGEGGQGAGTDSSAAPPADPPSSAPAGTSQEPPAGS